MTRKFVLCAKDADAKQQDAITKWLRSTPLGFWHHFSQLWVLVDRTDEYSATSIRDKVSELAPMLHTIVLDVTGSADDGWAGVGDTRAFLWMNKTWMGDYEWEPSARPRAVKGS